MGRHSALRRSSPAASVLGAGATALTIASLLAISQTTVLPTVNAGEAPAGSSRTGTAPGSDVQLDPGPLTIPSIGVVAPGFEDWYTTGSSQSVAAAPVQSHHRLAESVVSSLPVDDAASFGVPV